MAGIVTKDGRNVSTWDITYGRLDIGTGRTPIPVEFESLVIKAGRGNGDVVVYVGGDDVDRDNGYEIGAGNSVTIGFPGLGGYHAANSIYLTAGEDDVEVFYMAYN